MEENQKKADEFLKQRLALVSEIDSTEFAWKKKKKQLLENMGRLLNQVTIYGDKAKNLRKQFEALELEVYQDKVKAIPQPKGN